MKRQEVQITIKSIQHNVEKSENDQSYTGHYAFRSGEHLINYREAFDASSPENSVVKNLIRITGNTFSIKKTGTVTSSMFFKRQTTHQSIYQTPFGSFDLKLFTKQLEISTDPDRISVFINYNLYMNHSFISNCTIHIKIKLPADSL